MNDIHAQGYSQKQQQEIPNPNNDKFEIIMLEGKIAKLQAELAEARRQITHLQACKQSIH